MKTLIVFDGDNTLTNGEREIIPYRGPYVADIAGIVADGPEFVGGMIAAYEHMVGRHPERHPWRDTRGRVVSLPVDGYLRLMQAAACVMDQCGVLTQPTERRETLNRLFRKNYKKAATVFRDGVADTLGILMRRSPIFVVTNSETRHFKNKLGALATGCKERRHIANHIIPRVIGNAKKEELADDFSLVEETLEPAGFPHPVHLRRHHYYLVLKELLHRHGVRWSRLFVVGDNFHMDLALPLQLGANVALIANEFTPAWEVAFCENHQRAHVIRAFSDVLQIVKD